MQLYEVELSHNKKAQRETSVNSISETSKTRPDTWQDSRKRLGGGNNAKTARNSKIFGTDRPTRQGVESRVRD